MGFLVRACTDGEIIATSILKSAISWIDLLDRSLGFWGDRHEGFAVCPFQLDRIGPLPQRGWFGHRARGHQDRCPDDPKRPGKTHWRRYTRRNRDGDQD